MVGGRLSPVGWPLVGGPVSLVRARGLRREYRALRRRPGLWGAVADLFGGGGDTHVALEGLDLDIERGERVALIGPNGAGKSTTIKLLCGILQPTAGELSVNGRRPLDNRHEHVKQIGVVFGQRTQLWWDLAVQEALHLLGAVYGVPEATARTRIAEFDALLGLGSLLSRPVRELSLGQRMRCELAAALLHAPPLLMLDEPTIGLDVDVKARIHEFIRALSDTAGTTLLLTTHDLGGVEATCDRVLLLDQGKARFDGSVSGLRAMLGLGPRVRLRLRGGGGAPLDLDGLPGDTTLREDTLTIDLPPGADPGQLVGPLLARLAAAGHRVAALSVGEPPLEEGLRHVFRDSAVGP